jgi:hypothetical protein
MEGLSFLEDPKEADASVNHLKRKIRKRSLREPAIRRKRKIVPLPWKHVSVAAATLIMVVGSILVFRLNSPKQPLQTISLKKDKARAAESSPAAGAAQEPPVYSDALPTEKLESKERTAAKATKPATSAPVVKETEKQAFVEPNVSLSPEVALDQIEEQVKEEGGVNSQEKIQPLPPTAVAEARKEDKPSGIIENKRTAAPSSAVGITQNFITVSGRVAAASDTTLFLPNVKVTLKGTNNSVVTDYRGKFSMAVPPNSTLIFSREGMNDAEVSVMKRKTFDVLMKREGEEEITLSEEVSEAVEENSLSQLPEKKFKVPG